VLLKQPRLARKEALVQDLVVEPAPVAEKDREVVFVNVARPGNQADGVPVIWRVSACGAARFQIYLGCSSHAANRRF
jgi:hypothetical protein